LILPFNLTVLAMLYAMRQRLADDRPKAVDFLIGSPEENALYHWTRQARFGAHYAVQFRLPCRGLWLCTQGTDGDVTHRGAWRHAVDLEVEVDDGRVFRGSGDQLRDYPAYGLPVTASAPGTVVKVVDSVRDNPVGQPNLHQNWGNLVLIQHAPHLYSMTCHLQPGSIRVRPGQIVDTGDPVGACGNSGRSAVPHVHFQLQGSARIGDQTLALELHDVVRVTEDGEHLEATIVPREADRLRNPTRDDDLAALFEFEWGVPMDFVLEPSGRRERVRYDIDLFGRRYLVSEETGAKLYFDSRPTTFTVYDVVGGSGSVLRMIRDALPRVPLEGDERLDWIDYLPRRGRAGVVLRTLGDFILPFVPPRSAGRVQYAMRRRDGGVWIDGRAVDAGRRDFATRAGLERGRGLVRIEVDSAGATIVARRVDAGDAPPSTIGLEPARPRAREETRR
jgi:hypothetical protein